MHTLGYRFRPWTAAKSIADGESILDYVRETAREAGIDRKVRFGHRVIKCVVVERGGALDGDRGARRRHRGDDLRAPSS